MRITNMIKRRTLLSALPLLFASACARAQPTASGQNAAITAPSSTALTALIARPGDIAWLSFTGTVRLKEGNADVRPATLLRAMTVKEGTNAARYFDIWQIAGTPAIAAPTLLRGAGTMKSQQSDAGTEALWLEQSFAHPAFDRPVEYSLLAPTNARVMAIDATQIWLLDGALLRTPPALSGEAQAAFTAWRAG